MEKRGHVTEETGEKTVNNLSMRVTGRGEAWTHECSEDDRERIDQRRALRKAPEEEGREGAADRAEEHDPGVRIAVGEPPKYHLSDDPRRVEQGEDDRRRERRGQFLGERRDVEGDGEVGEPLDETGERLLEIARQSGSYDPAGPGRRKETYEAQP